MHVKKPAIKSHFEKKEITGNEVLSTLRSYYLYELILDEIVSQAKKDLSGSVKSKCLERVEKLRSKIKANCNDKLELAYLDYLKFKKEFGG